MQGAKILTVGSKGEGEKHEENYLKLPSRQFNDEETPEHS